MDFDIFINAVIEELNNQLNSCHTARCQKIHKNNGVTRHAIQISDNMHKTVPCYPMENYYELYHEPEDIKIIAEDIIKTYQEETFPDHLFNQLQSREQILDQVLFRIVNMDMNTELLKNIPHHDIPKLGLSMLFYLTVNTRTDTAATILLQNPLLKIWDIAENELLEHARNNTPLAMTYTITCMDELLTGHAENTADNVPPMYVITNKEKTFGAGCILYPGVLEEMSEKLNADFYILPSSIHETIAVPAGAFSEHDAKCLKNIVMCINQSELAYEDILSDNVYYYSREKHELSLGA